MDVPELTGRISLVRGQLMGPTRPQLSSLPTIRPYRFVWLLCPVVFLYLNLIHFCNVHGGKETRQRL